MTPAQNSTLLYNRTFHIVQFHFPSLDIKHNIYQLSKWKHSIKIANMFLCQIVRKKKNVLINFVRNCYMQEIYYLQIVINFIYITLLYCLCGRFFFICIRILFSLQLVCNLIYEIIKIKAAAWPAARYQSLNYVYVCFGMDNMFNFGFLSLNVFSDFWKLQTFYLFTFYFHLNWPKFKLK